MKKYLLFAIPLIAMSCQLLDYGNPEEETLTCQSYTLYKKDASTDDITFRYTLPRDYYKEIKWAFSCYSFDGTIRADAVISVSSIGTGNKVMEYTVAGYDFSVLMFGYSVQTELSSMPEYGIIKQNFPVSFDSSFDPYLAPSGNIISDDPKIMKLAKAFRTKDMIETIANVTAYMDGFDYDNNFYYMGASSMNLGTLYFSGDKDMYRTVPEILQDRTGICFEKNILGASILRACNIPTRIVVSYGHGWLELYLPAGGWIPIDYANPQREKVFSFPIQNWNPKNYADVTCVTEGTEPDYARSWDRPINANFEFGRVDKSLGQTLPDSFHDSEVFFANLRYIAVHPLDADSDVEEYMPFFEQGSWAKIYRDGTDLYLKFSDAAPSILIVPGGTAAVTTPLGTTINVRFQEQEGFILLTKM